jgi:hypothetical protein
MLCGYTIPVPVQYVQETLNPIVFNFLAGFYFAWIGFYTSWLIVPAILGVAAFFYGVGLQSSHTVSHGSPGNFCKYR